MAAVTLVFVYNADSGLFNTLTDIAHKTFAPETYSCNLCALTYGTFGMRQEWKEFLETLDCDMEFLHRNELFDAYGSAPSALPTVFIKQDGQLMELIPAAAINACATMADLKQLISGTLVQHQAHNCSVTSKEPL
jgi:hypothetical protein